MLNKLKEYFELEKIFPIIVEKKDKKPDNFLEFLEYKKISLYRVR